MKLQSNNEAIQKYYEIDIPADLSAVVEKGLERGEKLSHKTKMKKLIFQVAGAAAAVALSFLFLAVNPVFAAKIPLIGHIFERFQDANSYSGDFSSVATQLHNDTEHVSDSENTFSKTVNGTALTLSEVYCNNQALYLSILIESDEAFPDTFIDTEGRPVIALSTNENYSFNSNDSGLHYSEGEFINPHTYAGIVRIDLNDLIKPITIPESFTLDLTVDRIIGSKAEPDDFWGYTEVTPEEAAAMSDEDWDSFMKDYYNTNRGWITFPNVHENYWFDGSWSFSIPVAIDDSQTITLEINETNEDGVGIASVTKTPFEMTVYDIEPTPDYFMVALDADGDIMPYGGGGSANTFALQNRDISTIYIYMCDYDEYMDELKGYYWSDDYEENKKDKTFKELLDERSVYHTEVHFDE